MKAEAQIKFDCFTENFRSMGEYKGLPVICDGILPDETAEIVVTDKIDEVYYAKLKRITKASKFRVSPQCKIFSECGNCSLQYVDYKKQAEYKQQAIESVIERDGVNATVLPVQTLYYPYKYRNRVSLAFGHKGNVITLGYKDPRTGLITDINTCPVCDKWLETLVKTVKSYCGKFKIRSYSQVTGEGKVIGLNAWFIDNRLILNIEAAQPSLMGSAWLYKELLTVFSNKVHFWVSYKDDSGYQYTLVGGDKKAEVKFCNTSIMLKPNMRLPVNEKLFSKLMKSVEEKVNEDYTAVYHDCSQIVLEILKKNKNVYIRKGETIAPEKKPMMTFVELKDGITENHERFLRTVRAKKALVLLNDCDNISEVILALNVLGYNNVEVTPYDMQPQTRKITALLECRS